MVESGDNNIDNSDPTFELPIKIKTFKTQLQVQGIKKLSRR